MYNQKNTRDGQWRELSLLAVYFCSKIGIASVQGTLRGRKTTAWRDTDANG